MQSPYPSIDWSAGLHLAPPWTTAGGETIAPAWTLAGEPGRLRAVDPADEWGVEWTVSGPVRVSPHGITEQPADSAAAGLTLFCPSMRKLAGVCATAHRPRLWRERGPAERTSDGERIETASGAVRLAIREGVGGSLAFSVEAEESNARGRRESVNAQSALAGALAPYADFARRQAGLQPADYARVQEAAFRLIAGLRVDPRGPHVWCVVNRDWPGDHGSRAIYPLVHAWYALRPEIARALLDSLLREQASDGSIPLNPMAPAIADEADPALPYLAHAFRLAARAGLDRAWFDFAAPRIQQYLEHLLLRLDPDREGLPVWPSSDDAVVPELYEPDRVSTDLPCLLIREINALESVAGAFAIRSLDLAGLQSYREVLRARLRDFLWSPEHGAFWDRYRDGRPVLRQTLSSASPLLMDGLTPTERTSVLSALTSRQQLLSDRGALSWVAWPEDEEAPSVTPLAQLLLLEGLETASAQAEAAALRAALASDPYPLDSAERVALCMDTLAIPPDAALNIRALSPLLLWLDQRRKAVLVSVALVFVLVNAVILFAVFRRPVLMPQTLETSVGLARRYYAEARYEDAEKLMAQVLASPQRHETAFVEMGNILYRQGKWTEAEAAYRAQQGRPTALAEARHNLAVLLHEQGRPEEALALWREIATNHLVSAPLVATRARTALRLSEPAAPDAQRE